jgi:hypothetical protein
VAHTYVNGYGLTDPLDAVGHTRRQDGVIAVARVPTS